MRNRVGKDYAREPGATAECILGYVNTTVGDGNSCKTFTIPECGVTDGYYALGDRYFGKTCAIIESVRIYFGNTVWDGYRCKI